MKKKAGSLHDGEWAFFMRNGVRQYIEACERGTKGGGPVTIRQLCKIRPQFGPPHRGIMDPRHVAGIPKTRSGPVAFVSGRGGIYQGPRYAAGPQKHAHSIGR
jgi:hypothetical protein